MQILLLFYKNLISAFRELRPLFSQRQVCKQAYKKPLASYIRKKTFSSNLRESFSNLTLILGEIMVTGDTALESIAESIIMRKHKNSAVIEPTQSPRAEKPHGN